MTTKTKKAALLALLKRQYVSPLEALEHCGIYSLAQRVSEWRAQGLYIVDRWRDSPSGSRFKEYKFVGRVNRFIA